MKLYNYVVEPDNEGKRLDVLVSGLLPELSRSQTKNLISEGKITVNGSPGKASYSVKNGEQIKIILPELKPVEIKAQPIALPIIYQDQDLAVVDKPKGMVVHPAHGNWDQTMVNSLLYHITDLSGINGELRPGIVHRLDKDTSGVMVVAKNDQAHRELARQIKDHTINREYLALVAGVIPADKGTIDAPIGRSKTDRKKMAVMAEGRPAISQYQVIQRFTGNYTLVKIKLLTGRTHQIRVHMAYIRFPVLGDPIYGSGKNRFGLTSQALHAHLLGFVHPRSGEYMEFNSPMPDYMRAIVEEL